MAIQLDFAGVVNAAQTIVADKGFDYVYGKCDGMCVYFDEGKPSCLVGRILDTYGMTPEDVSGRNETTVSILFADDVIAGDYATRSFLMRLQTAQDSGRSWGKALMDALARSAKELHEVVRDVRLATQGTL